MPGRIHLRFLARDRVVDEENPLEVITTGQRRRSEGPEWSQVGKEFLSAVTADTIDDAGLSGMTSSQKTYLDYVFRQAASIPSATLLDILDESQKAENSDVVTIQTTSTLLTYLARFTKEEPRCSVDDAVEALVEAGVFSQHILVAEEPHNKARSVVFFLYGHIFMLYPALPPSTQSITHLTIAEDQTACFGTIQPLEICSRSVGEIMQAFGPLLPAVPTTSSTNIHQGLNQSPDALYVSHLNAATLEQMGGITLVWVYNISSHLHFDSESRELMVFAMPSFCEVSKGMGTPLSSLLGAYHDEFSKPAGFTSSRLLKEIRLSYRLLFSDHDRSRRRYAKSRKKYAELLDFPDELLHELCSQTSSRISTARNCYSKPNDFPILGSRLAILQEHVLNQSPNTARSLWQDRRDMLRWYTFWAVIIIGGAGLFLSLVQSILSAVQVAYSIRSSN